MAFGSKRDALSHPSGDALSHPPGDGLSHPPGDAGGRSSGFFLLFAPRQGYFITPILMYINIAVFVLMALSGVSVLDPTNLQLIHWGANVRFYTLTGGWWRLITCCFVHLGILHLLFNMYALMFIGLLLEPRLGRLRLTVAYLLTGITASLTSLYWHDTSVSVGASGAIFGLYGVFLAMLTTRLVDNTQRRALLISIGVFVAYNLAYGMKSGVDNAAHVGGLIGGIVIGYLFYPGLKRPQDRRYLYATIGASILFVLTASFIVFRQTPDDIVQYEKKMETFGSFEHAAMRMLRLSGNAPESEQGWLKDSGLYYWNRNIDLLEGIQQLKIPNVLHQRTTLLIEYCHLRIDYLNHPDSMAYFNSRILDVLDTLKGKPHSSPSP